MSNDLNIANNKAWMILKKCIFRRPVFNSVSCHTSKISEYVDYQLQIIVKEILSYIKDTGDFLRKLNNIEYVPNVVCLGIFYTNIPTLRGKKL